MRDGGRRWIGPGSAPPCIRIKGAHMPKRERPEVGPPPPRPPPVCPLCERPIPSQARSSRHHLTPRLKGGAKLGTVLLHQICHSAIHARFTEAQLAKRYNEVSEIKSAPEMADFLAWICSKPADFHAPTRMTKAQSGIRGARRLRSS